MQNEVTIIGAGIGGLTLAKSLELKGIPFQLYEKSKSFEALGYGINVGSNVTRVMKALGLAEKIAAISQQVQRTEARTFESDKVLMSTKYQNEFPHYQCRRADLHELIYDAVQDKSCIHFSKKLVAYTHNEAGVLLTFEDGSSIQAGAVVAADGVKSFVRHQMFPNQAEKYAGYLAYRAILPFQKKYQQLAGQATIWMGENHHVVCYPNGNERMRNYWLNLVLIEKNAAWNEEGWTIPADKKVVAKQFRNNSKLLNEILDDLLKSPEACYKWGLIIHDPLPYWTQKNITLLGDAAHPMVPFQGQGAAMAIEDAYVLANCFAKYKTPQEVFARYEVLRKERATSVQDRSFKNGLIYHASGIKKMMRNMLFSYIHYVNPNFMAKRMSWLVDHDVTVES